MNYDELSDDELRRILEAKIIRLSDEECHSLLTEKNVAENRAS